MEIEASKMYTKYWVANIFGSFHRNSSKMFIKYSQGFNKLYSFLYYKKKIHKKHSENAVLAPFPPLKFQAFYYYY